MELIFHLPLKAEKEDMQSFAQRKVKWIHRQLSFFEQFHPRTPARKYVSGETHLFLGREHKLRLIQSQSWKISVSRYYISVSTPDKENKHAIASRLSAYLWVEATSVPLNVAVTEQVRVVVGLGQFRRFAKEFI
jgi:predicted metal-dependent hydrolase